MALLTKDDLIFGVFLRSSAGEDLLALFVFERDARDFCRLYTKNRGDDVPRVFYRRLDNED